MVATLVFFDSSLTFGTWFSVGHDPSEILGLCSVFLDPLLNNIAITRLVSLLGALEACFLATSTLYILKRGVGFFLEATLAAFLATPCDKFVVIGE